MTDDSSDTKAEDTPEELEEERRKGFRAKCKILLICVAIFGFILKIIVFPILSILSTKYGWGIEFPELQLDTISALLSSLF